MAFFTTLLIQKEVLLSEHIKSYGQNNTKIMKSVSPSQGSNLTHMCLHVCARAHKRWFVYLQLKYSQKKKKALEQPNQRGR